MGDHRVEAITINNIGYVYESLGERMKALEYFNQAFRSCVWWATAAWKPLRLTI